MTVAEETGELRNPGLPGNEEFDTLIYGSPPLAYPAALSQYVIYNTPDPAYVTGRINVSAFANLGAATPWPFTNTNVPLNGHICIPRGRGPFPLAVFAHGNHNPFENSTPGYLYLCSLLASHGIIAATIDANFLNGGNFGENDARAIVHLEHLKQFRTWNNTATHPLHGKVDMNRILIVGHSRGGEGSGMLLTSTSWPRSSPTSSARWSRSTAQLVSKWRKISTGDCDKKCPDEIDAQILISMRM